MRPPASRRRDSAPPPSCASGCNGARALAPAGGEKCRRFGGFPVRWPCCFWARLRDRPGARLEAAGALPGLASSGLSECDRPSPSFPLRQRNRVPIQPDDSSVPQAGAFCTPNAGKKRVRPAQPIVSVATTKQGADTTGRFIRSTSGRFLYAKCRQKRVRPAQPIVPVATTKQGADATGRFIRSTSGRFLYAKCRQKRVRPAQPIVPVATTKQGADTTGRFIRSTSGRFLYAKCR